MKLYSPNMHRKHRGVQADKLTVLASAVEGVIEIRAGYEKQTTYGPAISKTEMIRHFQSELQSGDAALFIRGRPVVACRICQLERVDA